MRTDNGPNSYEYTYFYTWFWIMQYVPSSKKADIPPHLPLQKVSILL